jgi:arylsulfatase A
LPKLQGQVTDLPHRQPAAALSPVFRVLPRFSVLLLPALALLAPASSFGAAESSPNIVIILADDLGYGDIGSFGATRVRTPHLDRLAGEGMRFTDAHAPAGVCVPSRYGLMTGRYPFRNDRNPNTGPVIEEGRMTIASLLQSRGYTTAMVGKWHLGFEGGIEFDYDRPLRGGPVDRGFDSFFGIHASTDIPPYFYIRNDRTVMAPTDHIEARNSPGWTRIQGEFWRAGPIAPDLKLEEVMPRFTQEAVDWLDQHAGGARRQPFLLYVAFTAPHTPWLPTRQFQGTSAAEMYGDFIAQVDDSVGQILGALERAGAKENTLVFFTSDNGPVWYPDDVQRLGHAATGPYRGMKGDAWEGGHRMPFIARWPGRIGAGAVNATTISFVDFLATFADLTGAKLPANAGEDSFSILPALLGRAGRSRPPVATLSSRRLVALRDGDWKLIPALGSGGFSPPNKQNPAPGGPVGQLYNLARDPGEQHNLWQQEPEIVARLSARLKQYQDDGRSRR